MLVSLLQLEEEFLEVAELSEGWVPLSALVAKLMEEEEKPLMTGAVTPWDFARRHGYFKKSVLRCLQRLDGFVEVCRLRRRERVWVRLTDRGRALAIQYAAPEQQLDAAVAHLRKVCAERGQPPFATAEELLEAVWNCSVHDRRLFEKVWNKRKLCAEMRKRGYRVFLKKVDGKRVRFYVLVPGQADVEDIVAAIARLKNAGLEKASVDDILAALWETAGHKFPDKTALALYWTEKRVGKTMRALGVEQKRDKHKRFYVINGSRQKMTVQVEGAGGVDRFTRKPPNCGLQ